MIKVGIVGGTGYTGVELLRLLAAHPQVALQVITSRADADTPVNQMFPSLRGYVDLPFTHPDQAHLDKCDLVFFATPNGIAMQQVRALLDAGHFSPPEPELSDAGVREMFWPEIDFLQRMSRLVPDDVVDVLVSVGRRFAQ